MRLRLVTLAAVMAVAPVACGDDEPSGSATPSTSVTPGGRILVQAAGGDGELNALRAVVDAFESEHPGTTVEFVGLAEQSEHIAKLSTGFAAGRPPDVFLLNYRRFGRFATAGVIDPPRDVEKHEFYEEPLDAFTLDGTLTCLPQNISSSVTYYNPSLFQRANVALPAPGWTLEDMRSAALKLAAAKIEAIGFEFGMRTVAPVLWAHGGDVVDDLESPTRITFDTPEARATLTYLRGLLESGVTPKEAAAEPAEDRFARGELAMLIDSRRAVPTLRKAGLVFDVAPLPRGEESATLLASDAYCVSKASRNAVLAHAFSAYAVGPDGGRVLVESGRTVPSLKSLAESDAFLAPGKAPRSSKVWLDVIPTLMRLPNVGAWNETETTASDVLEQYFAGKLNLDQAIARTTSDSTRLLARG